MESRSPSHRRRERWRTAPRTTSTADRRRLRRRRWHAQCARARMWRRSRWRPGNDEPQAVRRDEPYEIPRVAPTAARTAPHHRTWIARSPHDKLHAFRRSLGQVERRQRAPAGHARPAHPPDADLRTSARTGDRARHPGTVRHVRIVDQGSAYPALQRLEERGFVDAEWGASEHNRRARFYTLTRKGRKELSREETEWRRIASAIMRVLGPRTS